MVANDPEHARLAEQAMPEGSEPWAPPHATWTPEVDMLAQVKDAVELVRLTLIAQNLEKGKSPPKFEPTPRPRTMMGKSRARSRREKHEALVQRVLPRKSD